ncbi:MAG: DegT/DnrJ/EryC1/StrS family aminotransferase [Candidatus Bathyarchaeia archaeon]
MRIPINPPSIGEEEIQAVKGVLISGILTHKGCRGPFVGRFEKIFADFVTSRYAIAMSSGTASLHAALLAAGVERGDEVILPSFTFVATAEAVDLVGARPIFVDINPRTFSIDPSLVKSSASARTKAIIAVDLYGLPCDMDALREVSDEHGAVLIEDAAQSLGAEYKGRRVGGIADITCFSLYATKVITTGEGGMVTTDHDRYAEKLRLIRSHGKRDERALMLGHNYRMTEIQAAIGVSQMSKLPRFLEKRRENANEFTSRLSGVDGIELPFEPNDRKHSWYVYTIRVGLMRDGLVRKLNKVGIGATVYYPVPVHLMPYYRKRLRIGRGLLRETEKAAKQVISLPVHPKMGLDDVRFISSRLIDAIDDVLH